MLVSPCASDVTKPKGWSLEKLQNALEMIRKKSGARVQWSELDLKI